MINFLVAIGQLIFMVVMIWYFYGQNARQKETKDALRKQSVKELERLSQMRTVSLTKPLTEIARPSSLEEIIGQKDGLTALKAALCGPNPQHILIYGPPGVGKTAAARVALEAAKKSTGTPFHYNAPFVEVDATIMRCDERGIADPLIGSVHDPIFQGAGVYGPAGIPQPKPGAVSKAHGGVLFIDEIGELPPMQQNKLLKVLEDRKVFFESSYYTSEDHTIPLHIHEIFDKGLPADFRLIGATTRSPEDIPPAIRSRCTEIFFDALGKEEIRQIASLAAKKGHASLESKAVDAIAAYAQNGRDAVNLIQTAQSLVSLDKRDVILEKDIAYVAKCGNFSPLPEVKTSNLYRIGCVRGLGVSGPRQGMVMDIEAFAAAGSGNLTVTGIVEEEELQSRNGKMRRMSTARASVETVITVLKRFTGFRPHEYDIHINFPGGMPVDGPSAGVAIFAALYSAIHGIPVSDAVALTGELSITGAIKPVGGVPAKIEAALCAGVKKVIIPDENGMEVPSTDKAAIIKVQRIDDICLELFGDTISPAGKSYFPLETNHTISAKESFSLTDSYVNLKKQ